MSGDEDVEEALIRVVGGQPVEPGAEAIDRWQPLRELVESQDRPVGEVAKERDEIPWAVAHPSQTVGPELADQMIDLGKRALGAAKDPKLRALGIELGHDRAREIFQPHEVVQAARGHLDECALRAGLRGRRTPHAMVAEVRGGELEAETRLLGVERQVEGGEERAHLVRGDVPLQPLEVARLGLEGQTAHPPALREGNAHQTDVGANIEEGAPPLRKQLVCEKVLDLRRPGPLPPVVAVHHLVVNRPLENSVLTIAADRLGMGRPHGSGSSIAPDRTERMDSALRLTSGGAIGPENHGNSPIGCPRSIVEDRRRALRQVSHRALRVQEVPHGRSSSKGELLLRESQCPPRAGSSGSGRDPEGRRQSAGVLGLSHRGRKGPARPGDPGHGRCAQGGPKERVASQQDQEGAS